MLQDSMCNPERVLFALANNKGYGGFHLTHVVVQGSDVLTTEARKNIQPALKQGIAKLGKGVEGFAFIGCLDTKCERMVVIKVAEKGLRHEYVILKVLSKLSPHVPVPYFHVKCKNREMLYEEYANGGDVIGFFEKYRSLLRESHLKTIVFQILWTLYTIQKSVPSFRHNDLHLGNVLLNFHGRAVGGTKYKVGAKTFVVPSVGLTALISDFGWASMEGASNPKVTNRSSCNSHGICDDNDKLYDAHLFLNSMIIEMHRLQRPALTGRLEKFIIEAFGGSMSYVGNTTNKVRDARLRFAANHRGLMSLQQMLEHPYFSSFHKKVASPRILPPAKPSVENLRMVAAKKKSPSPKKKSPSPKKNSPVRPCGKKARPVGGVGAERLTTKEMLELIVRKGHAVPKDKSRESLCAVIKMHKLNAPSPTVRAPAPVSAAPVKAKAPPVPAPPVPAPASSVPAPAPTQAPASLKAFIKAQGVTVIQPTNEHAWKIKRRKLQEELYNKMNKDNGSTYQNRMNAAGIEAGKLIREMRKK